MIYPYLGEKYFIDSTLICHMFYLQTQNTLSFINKFQVFCLALRKFWTQKLLFVIPTSGHSQVYSLFKIFNIIFFLLFSEKLFFFGSEQGIEIRHKESELYALVHVERIKCRPSYFERTRSGQRGRTKDIYSEECIQYAESEKLRNLKSGSTDPPVGSRIYSWVGGGAGWG